jgi:hypothetical protein
MVKYSRNKKIKNKKRLSRKKIDDQKGGYNSDINSKPNDGLLSKVLNIGTQLGEKVANSGIDAVAKFTGTNPNLPSGKVFEEAKEKLENIVDVVANTKIGDKLGSQLGEATQKILGPIEEKGSKILNDFAEKEQRALIDLGSNVLEDVPIFYPFVGIARTISSGLKVLENSSEALAESTGLLKEQIEKFNEVKKEITNTWEEIQAKASNVGNNINSQIDKKLDNFQDNLLNDDSKNIKDTNKNGKMIGGRVKRSFMNFINPTINTSKIRKLYGGMKTKKNY